MDDYKYKNIIIKRIKSFIKLITPFK
jgi:hypothetical protein